MGSEAERVGLLWAEQLRDANPALTLLVNCGGGSFKSQLKRADKSGAVFALVVGDEEAAQASVGVKALREDSPQHTWAWQDLVRTLTGCAAADLPRLLMRT